MPDYGSWEELCDAAQKKCHDILEHDVVPVAKEIVKGHIQSDIYDVYTPTPNGWVNGTTYQRRHVLETSMYYEFTRPTERFKFDEEIMVTSTAKASKSIIPKYSFHNRRPGAFLQMLEKGNMGILGNCTPKFKFPRPAIDNAQKEIDQSSAIRDAIQSGLDRYL